jgi:hypothetical protein
MTENSLPRDNRSSILERVTTPLAFLVLGLLVVESTIGALIISVPEYRGPLIWTFIASVPVYVLIVVVLAIFIPEALSGHRPLQSDNAHRLADNLFLSIDGYLRNLQDIERLEAWTTVAYVITTDDRAPHTYNEFAKAISERLKVVAKIGARSLPAPGLISHRQHQTEALPKED